MQTVIARDLEWIKEKAEQGSTSAQAVLGMVYLDGLGVAQDTQEALKWLNKAAKQGDEGAGIFRETPTIRLMQLGSLLPYGAIPP
ncbi:tetratricopeptide repeat protein [Parelusimicrobium proximum]|uniref:tetratricopeptide repeat protein n=1 Tax=Parelusimicrobium proximum TaxID=3228953 RepID=UPI003D1699AF